MSNQTASVDTQSLEDFQRDGFYLVRGLFSAEETAEIRDAFMAQGADGPVPGLSATPATANMQDPLSRYPRMMHPHRHPEFPVGSLSIRVMLDERIESILHDLFADEPVAAQSMFYFKPPGARGQDLHQDNFYLRVKPGTCIAMWLSVDDSDRENGGLVVVPKTGELEIACPEKSDSTIFFTTEHVPVPLGLEEMPVDMKAGDVLFFNGNVIHGSYPNESKDRFRRAFICHYLPASSGESSRWYHPLLRFNGEVVEMADATGGGPCGNEQAMPMSAP